LSKQPRMSPSSTHCTQHAHHISRVMWSSTLLDARHRLIAVEDLFRGTLSSASVHPREVVKAALAQNAAALVLFHNHPLGVMTILALMRSRQLTGLLEKKLRDRGLTRKNVIDLQRRKNRRTLAKALSSTAPDPRPPRAA
jgi:DNA repair protein RadC